MLDAVKQYFTLFNTSPDPRAFSEPVQALAELLDFARMDPAFKFLVDIITSQAQGVLLELISSTTVEELHRNQGRLTAYMGLLLNIEQVKAYKAKAKETKK